MSEDLKIHAEYLDEIIKYNSSALVGKIMKRFELFDDTKVLKKEIKELVYENYRTFREMLVAHTQGRDITQFHFQRPNHK